MEWWKLLQQTPKQILDKAAIQLGQCLLCHNSCQTIKALCDYCYHDLPTVNHPYQRNLLLWPKVAQHISHQYIDDLCCLSSYQWPYSLWINQLKYQQHFEISQLLARLLFKRFHTMLAESSPCIVATPMHINRWQERGYNQSHLLAKYLSRFSQLIYQQNLLIRVNNTDKQVGKNGIERRKNLKNAFMVEQVSTLPKHVLLVDDVVTTGSTANEMAKTLKKQGVEKVTVMAIALAITKIK